jgi:cyclin-dependent kinase 9
VKERLKFYVKDGYACDLLDKLLTLDPSKRLDADTALNHDFFWSDPMPCDLKPMLQNHSQSMFEYLAPPRRQGGPHHPRPQAQLPQPNKPSTDVGYHDRVF